MGPGKSVPPRLTPPPLGVAPVGFWSSGPRLPGKWASGTSEESPDPSSSISGQISKATEIDTGSLRLGEKKIMNMVKKAGIETEELPKSFKWEVVSPGGIMLKNIVLQRPLAVIDLETTGIDPKVDRIVEVSVLKLALRGDPDHRTRRVNPGVPIPPEATAVHGITDDDVVDCPTFRAVAPGLARYLDGCDLAGFNILKYDLRLLATEYIRAGVGFRVAGRKVIDACHIFHRREPRDLTAAYKFYCGLDHDGAHGAAADVLATLAVLDAQVSRYDVLP